MRRASELARDANRHFDQLMPRFAGPQDQPGRGDRFAQSAQQTTAPARGLIRVQNRNDDMMAPVWRWLENSNRQYQTVIVAPLVTGGPSERSLARRQDQPSTAPSGSIPDRPRIQPQSPVATPAAPTAQPPADTAPRAPSAPAVVARPSPPPTGSAPATNETGALDAVQIALQKWFDRANRTYNSVIVKRLAQTTGTGAAPTSPSTPSAPPVQITAAAPLPAPAPETRPPTKAIAPSPGATQDLNDVARAAEQLRREREGRRLVELAQQKTKREADARVAAEQAARAAAEQSSRQADAQAARQKAEEIAKAEAEKRSAQAQDATRRAEAARSAAAAAAAVAAAAAEEEQRRLAAEQEQQRRAGQQRLAEARKAEQQEQARQLAEQRKAAEDQRRLAEGQRRAAEAQRVVSLRAETERKLAAERERRAARAAELQKEAERRAIEIARQERLARERTQEQAERQAAQRRLVAAAKQAEQVRLAEAARNKAEEAKRSAQIGRLAANTPSPATAKRANERQRLSQAPSVDRNPPIVTITPAPALPGSTAASSPKPAAQNAQAAIKRTASTRYKARTKARKRNRRQAKSYRRQSRSGLGATRQAAPRRNPSGSRSYRPKRNSYKKSRAGRNGCRHDTGLLLGPGSNYIVRPGDTLRAIAELHYEDGGTYPLFLLRANTDRLDAPDEIGHCMQLLIPLAA